MTGHLSSAVMRLLKSVALLATSLLSTSVDAAASQTFTWKNVRIGGGGMQRVWTKKHKY